MVKPARSFVVGADSDGQRVDRFVADRCSIGRRAARLLVERGLVRVADRRCVKARRLEQGETVIVDGAAHGVPEPEPESPLSVVLERADLVVVDKPPGQPSAPLEPTERGSLAAALLGRYPEMEGVGHRDREPGLLHRLDTQTSGLVIAARTAQSFAALWGLLTSERLEKRYLAIVEGAWVPKEGVIDEPLFTKPDGRVSAGDGRAGRGHRVEAKTRFRLLERRGRWALLEVEAKRAHRHQVRAHLALSGFPIAGDAQYGGGGGAKLGGRHALHASYVAWAGEGPVAPFVAESVLPDDLAAFFRGEDASVG